MKNQCGKVDIKRSIHLYRKELFKKRIPKEGNVYKWVCV